MSIAIEGNKYIEESESHLEEHEVTIDKMEGHECDYSNEIADLSQSLELEKTTKESLEETFAVELSKIKESSDRALEVANDFKTKNDKLEVANVKLLEDFEHLENGSRSNPRKIPRAAPDVSVRRPDKAAAASSHSRAATSPRTPRAAEAREGPAPALPARAVASRGPERPAVSFLPPPPRDPPPSRRRAGDRSPASSPTAAAAPLGGPAAVRHRVPRPGLPPPLLRPVASPSSSPVVAPSPSKELELDRI
nr:translation initiation factor IF-2-like [Aegilops tauschii subsp. strangulata]